MRRFFSLIALTVGLCLAAQHCRQQFQLTQA